MGKNCTCPICRHCRGELTDREFAWYLKGTVEILSMIPKSVLKYCWRKDASKEEHHFADNADLTLCDNAPMLQEFCEKYDIHDMAFKYPEEFRPPREG